MRTKNWRDEPLTDAERKAVRLAGKGLTNDAIAKEMLVSVSSVKAYLGLAYGKLHVSNRAEAAAHLARATSTRAAIADVLDEFGVMAMGPREDWRSDLENALNEILVGRRVEPQYVDLGPIKLRPPEGKRFVVPEDGDLTRVRLENDEEESHD